MAQLQANNALHLADPQGTTLHRLPLSAAQVGAIRRGEAAPTRHACMRRPGCTRCPPARSGRPPPAPSASPCSGGSGSPPNPTLRRCGWPAAACSWCAAPAAARSCCERWTRRARRRCERCTTRWRRSSRRGRRTRRSRPPTACSSSSSSSQGEERRGAATLTARPTRAPPSCEPAGLLACLPARWRGSRAVPACICTQRCSTPSRLPPLTPPAPPPSPPTHPQLLPLLRLPAAPAKHAAGLHTHRWVGPVGGPRQRQRRRRACFEALPGWGRQRWR